MLAVLRRDLSEHGWVLVPASLLALAGLVLQASTRSFHETALLRAFDGFMLLCLTPLAVLAIRQLVVVEYQRRGVDLLETLPVSWPAVLVGKLLLGASLIAGVLVTGAGLIASALGWLKGGEPPEGAAE